MIAALPSLPKQTQNGIARRGKKRSAEKPPTPPLPKIEPFIPSPIPEVVKYENPEIVVPKNLLATSSNPQRLETLPRQLRDAGNFRQWNLICEHMSSSDKGHPLLVAGPTGSGKIYGCKCILDAMNVTYQVLDASFKWEEIEKTLVEMVGTFTFGGIRAILIQGINGFQKEHITGIQSFLKSASLKKSVTPIIATCTDRWALEIQSLRSWKYVTLYKLQPTKIFTIMRNEHKTASLTSIKYASENCEGDLRKCVRLIEQSQKDVLKESEKDCQRNIFEETKLLLQGRISADEWCESSNNRSYSSFGEYPMLLHHNLTDLENNMNDLASMTESVSLVATNPSIHLHQFALRMHNTQSVNDNIKLQFPKKHRSMDPPADYTVPALLGGLRLQVPCVEHQSPSIQ